MPSHCPPIAIALSKSDPTYPNTLPRPTLFPHRTSRHVRNTLLWLLLAALVAAATALIRGPQHAIEFLTGYIVEYSLSVDNLFVFLLIFKYFKVPLEYQPTVLTYGILGAMALRAVMIIAGKALVQRFEWLTLAFAILLIFSAGKLLLEDDHDDNLDQNRVIRFSKALFPLSNHYSGTNFFIRHDAKLMATPLAVVLVAIELSDVIFALDSVPAVLGISDDLFVIYSSNILAVMGLRSLFFVMADCIGNLRFLKHSLSLVLAFIGLKMIAAGVGYELGVTLSLFVVAFALATGVAMSLAFPPPPQFISNVIDNNSNPHLTHVNSV